MITYLKVRNLAIVEEFAIELDAGLNVLTGETGAGKSLLIDSLELMSGARGSSESIRAGEEKMSAEAIFQLPSSVASSLDEMGVDAEPANGTFELIAKREISRNGRGRVLLNGSAVGVRELTSAMDQILEIHGQDASHHRIAGQSFREILDEYGRNDGLLEDSRKAFAAWKAAAEDLARLRSAERELSLRLDLLKYQIDEIRGARVTPEEEETLRSEKVLLSHAREMIEATAGAFGVLDEDEDSALSQIARAEHLLQPLSGSIEDIRTAHTELEEIRYRLQDLARTLSALSESVRHDPARLDEIEDRLVTIERLKKKYGGSIEAVLAHLEASVTEYDQLVEYESSLAKCEKAEDAAFVAYRAAADKLSSKRKKDAAKFQDAIQSELVDVAMERTTVRVSITTSADPDSRLRIGDQGIAFGAEGFDRVDILIAPNRGEEPKPMHRIASGGELSRIQLAIAAAVFKESDKTVAATLIFDEIDSGIGGRVAEAVGKKLRDLAKRNQVICVTHLPQIASLGTTHFRVWKEDVKGRTRARIERLDDREQRIDEIARMLGGEKITDSARTHAAELLERGQVRERKRGTPGAVTSR